MLLRKKLLLLGIVLSVLLCSSLVVSVDAASMWSQAYGGTDHDVAYSVVATSDGGYALAGTAFYANYLDLEYGQQLYGDFWFVKTDELGVVPEYSSWLVPALVLTATAFIIVNKKRLLHKRL
jgi:hypothetical protein